MKENEKETIIILTDYLKVLIEFAKLIKDYFKERW